MYTLRRIFPCAASELAASASYQKPCNDYEYTGGKGMRSSRSLFKGVGYGLDDRSSRVPFPAGAGNFSLHHRVQNGSGSHPASYPMRTRGSFPGGEADHSPPSSAEVKNAWSYTSTTQYVFMAWCLVTILHLTIVPPLLWGNSG
jgi:hypothetical protein